MVLSSLLLILLQAPEVPPDVVTLKGDKTVEGILLYADPKVVVLGIEGKVKELKTSKVVDLAGPRISYAAYVKELKYVYGARAEASDAAELAVWCEEVGLLRDVELHWWRALDLDPEFLAAHEALGHKRDGGEWRISTGTGATLPLKEYEQRLLEREEYWKFSTAHFDLRSCSTLSTALRTAATLEVLYFHFYELLQPVAAFYELREPITVYAHKDRESGYPEVGPTVRGYYDIGINAIHTYHRSTGEGVKVVQLHRLISHALQYRAAFERSKGAPDQYPGWLWEGLSTYFEACYFPTDGAPDYLPDRLNGPWITLVYKADPKERHDIPTLLAFERESLGQQQDAQMLYGEAYALCYYLLQTEELGYVESFRDYLRDAYSGRGDASRFRKAFGKKTMKTLEKDWATFVEKAALRLQH
ncbi:MAG: hypothetical protein ACPG31_09750 [Planctomycetota bacterium]